MRHCFTLILSGYTPCVCVTLCVCVCLLWLYPAVFNEGGSSCSVVQWAVFTVSVFPFPPLVLLFLPFPLYSWLFLSICLYHSVRLRQYFIKTAQNHTFKEMSRADYSILHFFKTIWFWYSEKKPSKNCLVIKTNWSQWLDWLIHPLEVLIHWSVSMWFLLFNSCWFPVWLSSQPWIVLFAMLQKRFQDLCCYLF